MPAEDKNIEQSQNDIDAKVELVRNQVDLLRVEVADKKRPWFKQVPVVVSMVSLMVSFTLGVVGFVYQYKTKKDDDINKQIESLNEIMVNVSDI